jgi:hypothetical protein
LGGARYGDAAAVADPAGAAALELTPSGVACDSTAGVDSAGAELAGTELAGAEPEPAGSAARATPETHRAATSAPKSTATHGLGTAAL